MGAPETSRRIGVLMLVDRLYEGGGAERLAVEIAARLDPDRFERTLCVYRRRREYPFVRELEAAGVRVLLLEGGGRADLLAWRPLLALLRSGTIDVLHAHKFGPNVWGTLFGRLARVPVVVAHEHSWSYEGQPLRRLLDRELIARFASAFVAVSEADRRRMHEVERIRPERTRRIPNGIPPLPPPSGNDVRAELGIPADAPLAVAVAVLRPEKALDVLIRAAASLAPRFPELRWLVVGGGLDTDREPLAALARELGVADRVVLTGSRTDVPDLLAAADVTVLSSDREGSPLSVMEYMAAGKPVVATRVGGVPDLIRDGVDGILVPRRDPTSLAEGVARLLEDPGLRRRMGESARRRQRAELDVDVTVRRVEELYEELLAARGRR